MTLTTQATATTVINGKSYEIPVAFTNPTFLYVDIHALLDAFLGEYILDSHNTTIRLNDYFKNPNNIEVIAEWEKAHNPFFNDDEFNIRTKGATNWELSTHGISMALINSKTYVVKDIAICIIIQCCPLFTIDILNRLSGKWGDDGSFPNIANIKV